MDERKDTLKRLALACLICIGVAVALGLLINAFLT